MNRKDIHFRLEELNRRLAGRNSYGNLFVYGGFVMCYAYEMRDSTEDIDCIHDNHFIDEIAREMASEHNYRMDWLNTAIKDYVHTDMIKNEHVGTINFSNLSIRVPSPEQMLAMKLFSARTTGRDFEDAVSLAKGLSITSLFELRAVLKKYFKESSIREKNRHYHNSIGRFMEEVSNAIKGVPPTRGWQR